MNNSNQSINGQPLQFDIEPWQKPVNGEELIDDLAASLRSFVVMRTEEAYAIAFWIIHTYFIRPPNCPQVFDFSPILNISSPERQCGKSTLRELIYELVPRPLNAMNASESALFRKISSSLPTLLIDEADTFLRNRGELAGILNSGYKQDGNVLRQGGKTFEETMEFSTWSPKCIAGIGRHLDTLESRCLTIKLKRKKTTEVVDRRNRVLKNDPDYFNDYKRKILRFVKDNESEIISLTPELPMELDDRTLDNWHGIFKIATHISEAVLEKAKISAKLLASLKYDDQSISIELLRDIQQIINRVNQPRYSSSFLVDELKKDLDRPWATYNRSGLSPNNLASLLREFDIYPKQGKIGVDNLRGYDKEMFTETFDRYL